MRFHKRKLATVLTALLFLPLAGAEEDAASAKKDGPLPRDEREFYEKTARMNSLATRIEESEKQFAELVRKKAGEKNADEKQRLIKDMVDTTNDRNKSVEEYNKVKAEIALRYPNRGEHLNRRYQTQSKKSVEELEGAAGLDELLTRTKKVVEKKFAPLAPAEDPKKPVVKPTASDEEESKRLRLEK